ncbi:MAG: outer membrane beta-barrel family protein, partial [Dysgonamonadaceae bacterium]|nr:outer membrane beta-barrel family protein [Dysgonamonadaceae bacterium]
WKTNNTLQFAYNIRYNHTDNVRETYDYDEDTETYSILNPDYSKSLWNHFVNQTFGMSFNAVHTKYTYNIGFNINPSYTQSTSYVKNGSLDGSDSILNKVDGRSVINYSPQLRFTYRFSRESNLRFTYRGNTNQPSISQLDPTPNNTNPLNIRVGNPDLLPSFSHNLSLNYNHSKRASQRSLTGNLQFSFVRNEIINFTSYQDTTGIQQTMPVNENGSWNSTGEVLYNMPLDAKKKFKFSTQTRLSYNNRIGYIRTGKQSERNTSGTMGIYENIGLSYSKDWFYGQLRGNMRYSKTTNTLEGREDQQNSTLGITYNTQLYFPRNWVLASDINYRATRGLSAGYNTNEIIWNAEISKQFLSKKQATFRIKWYDILHQTLSINRSINANYIEDNEYNILTGYILVSFSYRLNQMGGRMNRR